MWAIFWTNTRLALAKVTESSGRLEANLSPSSEKLIAFLQVLRHVASVVQSSDELRYVKPGFSFRMLNSSRHGDMNCFWLL